MEPIVIDNFLDDFDSFNRYARSRDFTGQINPFDGVFYPDISTDIPPAVVEEVGRKTRAKSQNAVFMRLTSKNTKGAPHQAHNDSVMGAKTFLLYLQDGPGGTSLVRHKQVGMEHGPKSAEEEAIWKRDTNTPEAWEVVDMIDMKKNRAFILPSQVMHRAEPVGGFGQSEKDGRICLIMFYD